MNINAQTETNRCKIVIQNKGRWLRQSIRNQLFKLFPQMQRKPKKVAAFVPSIIINNLGEAAIQHSKKAPRSQDEHNIYSSPKANSEIDSENEESSFQLQEEHQIPEQHREHLDKLLDRLGLKEQLKTKSNNQELQIIVNNFLENCIGTVNRKANTEEYDLIYDSAYQQKLKSVQSVKGTIFISELTELQKVRMISDKGISALYRKLRLFMKYVSMFCNKIVQHPLFEAFILIIILLNSLKMATDDPLATTTNLPQVETAFTAIYVTEMTIKIFAFGFAFNKGAYLRDLWNILDFIIVVTSLLPIIIDIGFSVSALRAIRVLRPLRTITKVKALKMIVKTLFNSFSLVMDSLSILFMIMGIFAIAGMQLFGGFLKYRCMNQATGVLSSTLCSGDGSCSSGSICVKGISSPNFSIINFDTLFWSFISVFQIITCEGWSLIMIYIQQVKGLVYSLYSVAIVVICLYILLNMTMAILKYKYAQVKSNKIEEQEEDLQEYEPQFLKKIGIFSEISALSEEPPLIRINHPFRQQIGSSLTLPLQEKMVSMTTRQLVAHLEDRKASENVQALGPDQIDLKEIRQFGKYQDYKWDANNLVFQTNIAEQREVVADKNEGKPASDKSIAIKEEEEESIQSQLNQSYFSEVSSQQEEDESSKQIQIADKVLEIQKKLKHSVKNIGTSKSLKRFQPTSTPRIEEKVLPKRELSEFDQLLELIGTKPGMVKVASQEFSIPEVDFSKVSAQRIYERFADLGEYGMRRVEKGVQLGSLQVAKKHISKGEIKKKSAPVQEVVEQNALDIKQLHLKNELLKMKLRCRVKSDELIEEQRKYDITRVIISQKLKQIELKKNQIKDNMNSMHYSVKYKLNNDKSKTEESNIYSRNLESEKMILKLPEITQNKEEALEHTHENQVEASNKIRDNSHYLRMLQNHQMEEKIELEMDRIMAVFFKKEHPRRKTLKGEEVSLEEEYESVHEEDILKRHGHIELQYPFSSIQQEQSLEMINMKMEEYEIHIKGLFGLLRVIRKKVFLIVSHNAYDNFILLIVFLNTALMTLNGYIDTDLSPYSYINEAFTIIFIIDLFLKVFAYGINFFGDVMNLFDTAVVAVSIMEMTLGSSSTTNLSALRSIRILRAFRVLRITRLIRSLSYMRIVMGVVTSIITQFIYVFLLLSLFVFIYTLLGMQIFGGNLASASVTGIRQNYDTFFNALFTIFQVMTIENWNDIETATVTSSMGNWGIIFLVSWIFLGNWILLNLLQAILLDGFDNDSINSEEELGDSSDSATTTQQQEEEPQKKSEEELISKEQSETKSQKKQEEENTPKNNDKDQDASLFIFKPDNPIRMVCKAIATSTAFEVFMFIIILSSSGKLAFDTYIDQSTSETLSSFSTISNYIFNGLFILECFIKIIHMGFVVGEHSYLGSSWNKLDFGIVCISIIDMSLAGVNLSIFKLLRTLRPLRIITRNEEMKIMVTSLAQSFLGIFNVLIICLCVFLMFAILGMNLLQGKLNYCNTQGGHLITGSYGPFNIGQSDCVSSGGVWTTQLINFQNIGNSMISLYVFSTRENWPFYVYTFIDSSDTGPVKDNSQILYFVYAVLFIFIGSLFFMDLLVGVMFMNYHEAENKIRPKTLSNKQINWQNLQRLIVTEDPCFELYLAPSSQPRKFLFHIVSSKSFEIFVGLIIMVNILVMSLSDDDISQSMNNTLSSLNSAFTYVFFLELLLKLIVYGKSYFLSGWNIFDFFVVSASVLDLILQYSGIGSGGASEISILPQIARIFRVLRITRLLRMVKSFKGLQKLIQTFVFSLPAIGKGLMILVLYLFISSILASNLMGSISSDYGGNMNQVLNYTTFHNAFETLFVNLTGENWYYYMFFSTSQGFVQCIDSASSCVSPVNFLFWLPFLFLGQKVFLQLFVLIVLDQFEANYINENNPLGVFSLFEDDFRDNWIKATTKYHSEKIQSKRLIDLMLALRPPLGLGREQTLKKYEEELESNQKLTKEEVSERVHDLDKKLKKNAARLLHKMNVMKNRIYFGYHETFFNFAKLSIVPEFIDEATQPQKEALQAMHKESEQALEKVKPSGNLFYYSELEGEQNINVPLNPISLILFTQIIVKGWHNYSVRNKANSGAKPSASKNEPYDSLNNSCASDLAEADYLKMANERKAIMRRGGLLQNRLDMGVQNCQFKPIPNMCAAYGEGKRTKHKVSIMKRSRSSLEGLMVKKRSSKNAEKDIIRVSKGHAS